MNTSNLFVDISSDQVFLSCGEKTIFLERNGIENVLWWELIKLEKKYWFRKVFILNWPWGFTNLRVWTLCLNLLNTLLEGKLDFYSVSKPELYRFMYENTKISRYGVIYLGQRNNVWLRDFEKWEKVEQISLSELKWEFFLDIVQDSDYYPENMKGMKMLNYNEIQNFFSLFVEKNSLEPVKSVVANYMIEPISGWKCLC